MSTVIHFSLEKFKTYFPSTNSNCFVRGYAVPSTPLRLIWTKSHTSSILKLFLKKLKATKDALRAKIQKEGRVPYQPIRLSYSSTITCRQKASKWRLLSDGRSSAGSLLRGFDTETTAVQTSKERKAVFICCQERLEDFRNHAPPGGSHVRAKLYLCGGDPGGLYGRSYPHTFLSQLI